MEDKKPMVCPATCSSHNNANQTEFVNPDKPKSENRSKKVETICSFELEINEPRLGIFNSGSNELTIPGMLESIDMLRRTFDTIVKLALEEEEEDTLQTQKNKSQSTDDRTLQTQINKNQYTDDYTPQTQNNKNQYTDDYPKALNECSDLMVIGPNGTTIKRKYYDELLLKDAPEAIRLLCDLIFGDNILATHSLTGNQSRTNKGRERPPKKQLDPLKTDDITQLICSKFNVSQQLVRSRINTKCTVAAKRLKRLSYKTTL